MVAAGDNLASKLAEAGAVQLMAVALARAGFNEALKLNQTPATLQTICTLLGWAPCVVSIIMLLVLLKMDIQKEMAESRPAEV
jgi:Na+/melibiose symporter-like transporter